MTDITIRVDIPSIDHLADVLAGWGAPDRPVVPEAPEPPKAEPAPIPAPIPASEPKPEPKLTVTLGAVQQAAAQLRDQGKLKAVTDMFPEFGIRKLSDLEGDSLAAFADRMRAMGANV